MEAFLKKYFWVFKALGIATATGLAASAVTTHLGAQFLLDVDGVGGVSGDAGDDGDDEDEDGLEGLRPKKRPRARSSVSTAKFRAVEQIKKYNLFCPTCVEATATGPVTTPQVDESGQPVGIQPGEIKSSLPLKLMATLEAEEAENSFATVFDTETNVAGLYGIGEEIRPGVVVVGVDLGLLHIRNNVQLEFIELGGEVAGPAKPATTTKPKKRDKDKKPKNDREIPGADEAIDCPTENRCTVERGFVEKILANPAMLAKQARIVPSRKNGENQGFKFYGIRRGSLPKKLGLKNGDMITEVNGTEIKGVDQAMALYTKLRRASNLNVTIVRKGKPMTKEIVIQ